MYRHTQQIQMTCFVVTKVKVYVFAEFNMTEDDKTVNIKCAITLAQPNPSM